MATKYYTNILFQGNSAVVLASSTAVHTGIKNSLSVIDRSVSRELD